MTYRALVNVQIKHHNKQKVLSLWRICGIVLASDELIWVFKKHLTAKILTHNIVTCLQVSGGSKQKGSNYSLTVTK